MENGVKILGALLRAGLAFDLEDPGPSPTSLSPSNYIFVGVLRDGRDSESLAGYKELTARQDVILEVDVREVSSSV